MHEELAAEEHVNNQACLDSTGNGTGPEGRNI
jgi:hypothetical protein